MYGSGDGCRLNPSIVQHGELPEEKVWNFIDHAKIGLALATGSYAFDNDMSKIYSYLRGGLPVLSEEFILNNDLIEKTGLGKIFRFNDIEDLIAKALSLLKEPPSLAKKRSAMHLMFTEHSWEQRVDTYLRLFNELQATNTTSIS